MHLSKKKPAVPKKLKYLEDTLALTADELRRLVKKFGPPKEWFKEDGRQ